jgi:peptidoglycan/xylan/chitin deacetylase (PgdA/CDA1 family)
MKPLLFLWAALSFLYSDAHIFLYHRFGDSRFPSTNTTIKELKREFEYLKTNGYKVVPLSYLIKLYDEKKPIDDNLVSLVIDDNFKSFYQNGLEVFKEYGYPFSLFVYAKAAEKRYSDYSSWKELKEIAKYGSLEYHCYSHIHMSKTNSKELKDDFKKGLEVFEKRLGFKPKFFTYPYGEYNERVAKIAKSFGFSAIFNQNPGAFSLKSDKFDIPRNPLVGKSSLKIPLRYKVLKAKWLKPLTYPKDGVIKDVEVEVNCNKKTGSLYITDNGWHNIKIKNGKISNKPNAKVTRERVRVIVGAGNRIDTKCQCADKSH